MAAATCGARRPRRLLARRPRQHVVRDLLRVRHGSQSSTPRAIHVAVSEIADHAEDATIVVPVAERASEPRLGRHPVVSATPRPRPPRRADPRRTAGSSAHGSESGCRPGGRHRRSASRFRIRRGQRPWTKNVAGASAARSVARMRSPSSVAPGRSGCSASNVNATPARSLTPVTHGSSPSRHVRRDPVHGRAAIASRWARSWIGTSETAGATEAMPIAPMRRNEPRPAR